jgi:hypothetical protein
LAVALKGADVAAAGTVTLAGVVTAAPLDERETTVALPTAWARVTVQELICPGVKVEGMHCKEPIAPTAAPAPVPLKVTVWGDPAALSVTVTRALRLPAAVGVKVTEIVQLPPTATLAAQVLV